MCVDQDPKHVSIRVSSDALTLPCTSEMRNYVRISTDFRKRIGLFLIHRSAHGAVAATMANYGPLKNLFVKNDF